MSTPQDLQIRTKRGISVLRAGLQLIIGVVWYNRTP